MGRKLSGSGAASAYALELGGGYQLPGQLPIFGTGGFVAINRTSDFIVPDDVFSIRVRVVGGGAGVSSAGSTSFGAFLSATGGTAAVGAVPGQGGVGHGGDFQAAGGPGGAGLRGGGGAAGSELGDGGAGGAGGTHSGGGGGAVGGKNGGSGLNALERMGGGGASPFAHGQTPAESPTTVAAGGPDITGRGGFGPHNPGSRIVPHVLWGFFGGGGYSRPGGTQAAPGGSGAGGAGGRASSSLAQPGGHGGICGGGGGAGGSSSAKAGVGGFCWSDQLDNPPYAVDASTSRIGGGAGGNQIRAGGGGGGYARGVLSVLPGQVIPCTVAMQSVELDDGVSGGLIIVEW